MKITRQLYRIFPDEFQYNTYEEKSLFGKVKTYKEYSSTKTLEWLENNYPLEEGQEVRCFLGYDGVYYDEFWVCDAIQVNDG